MKIKVVSMLCAAAGILALAGCFSPPPQAQAYWQRVEDNSALYLTGPKAQQELEENITWCVHAIDEMVEMDALRKTMPPETHSAYHRALDASGDLAYYDTPSHYRDLKVAHSDFHDFESCMRNKGWERVVYTRYQAAANARNTYREVRQYRETGLIGDAAIAKKLKMLQEENDRTSAPNE
jgi:hypothetical protein